MRYIFLLISLSFMSCTKVKPTIESTDYDHFNLQNSTELAIKQDSLIARYNSKREITKSELDSLEYNIWYLTAKELAPSNLVIRQMCLIDLIKDSPNHDKEILAMVKLLSYQDDGDSRNIGALWAEGYSYWKYTFDFLNIWLHRFSENIDVNELTANIENIEKSFAKTAYKRNGVWYPAPYGDVWDSRLESEELEYVNFLEDDSLKHSIVIKETINDTIYYEILGVPIGLNTHIYNTDSVIVVMGGYPINFEFYNGYSNKYSSKEEELKDMFAPERLETIDDKGIDFKELHKKIEESREFLKQTSKKTKSFEN